MCSIPARCAGLCWKPSPRRSFTRATALADLSAFKHFDRTFHETDRLRTEGADALLAAVRALMIGGDITGPLLGTLAWFAG